MYIATAISSFCDELDKRISFLCKYSFLLTEWGENQCPDILR